MLSFVTLLAYDYKYAFDAIRSYYDIADEIILGYDHMHKSWSGNYFEFPVFKIKDELDKIDTKKKMRRFTENFHAHGSPIENDTFERNELSKRCKPGNWIVQIDADERIIYPGHTKHAIEHTDPQFCVQAVWCSVYKTFGTKALIIEPVNECQPIATKLQGQYTAARRTNQPPADFTIPLLHYSWGRTADELRQKLTNWSHSQETNVDEAMKVWESVTLDNYQELRDFHPGVPQTWHQLKLVEMKV